MTRVVALFALTAVTVLCAACGSDADDEQPSTAAATGPAATGPRAPRSGEARVRGKVLENDLGCRVGRRCALRLRTEGGDDLLVVYHYGENPPCANAVAAQAGQEIHVGDRVEVLGRWGGGAADRHLSTCDDAAYAIRRL